MLHDNESLFLFKPTHETKIKPSDVTKQGSEQLTQKNNNTQLCTVMLIHTLHDDHGVLGGRELADLGALGDVGGVQDGDVQSQGLAHELDVLGQQNHLVDGHSAQRRALA